GGATRGKLFQRLNDQHQLDTALNNLLGHDALLNVAPKKQLELHLQQNLLDDRTQTTNTGLALQSAVGNHAQHVLKEDELDPIEREEALELLNDHVAQLSENNN